MPLNAAPQWVHYSNSFALAVLPFSIVFGAFPANVLFGTMHAVPNTKIKTAKAYRMTRRQTFWRIVVPQIWVYVLLGLSNR